MRMKNNFDVNLDMSIQIQSYIRGTRNTDVGIKAGNETVQVSE